MPTVSITFTSTEEGTSKRIADAFSANSSFFKSRGVATPDELKNVISREFGLKGMLSTGTPRAIEFSNGFYVNNIDKRMVGYMVTMSPDDVAQNVIGTWNTPGYAVLYGISSEDMQEDHLTAALSNMGLRLKNDDLWDGGQNGIHDAYHSSDRSIIFYASKTCKFVYFIYVRVRMLKLDDIDSDTKLRDVKFDVYEKNMQRKVEDAINAFTRQVFLEEFAITPKKLWSSAYNVAAHGQTSLVMYNNCYSTRSTAVMPVVNPIDGMLRIYYSGKIDEENHMHNNTSAESWKYLEMLRGARFTECQLGFFIVPAVNMDSTVGSKITISEKVKRYRGTRIYFDGEDIGFLGYGIEYEETLKYFTDIEFEKGANICVMPERIVFQTPVHAGLPLSNSEFLEYHQRVKAAKIYVNMQLRERIIYMLQHVRPDAEYSFDRIGGVLVFPSDIIDAEKKQN